MNRDDRLTYLRSLLANDLAGWAAAVEQVKRENIAILSGGDPEEVHKDKGVAAATAVGLAVEARRGRRSAEQKKADQLAAQLQDEAISVRPLLSETSADNDQLAAED